MSNDNNIHNLDTKQFDDLHVKADSSVVISCGNASITLHRDGTVDITGDSVRINGRDVQLTGTLHFN